jgi:hypothetical protein
MNIITMRDRHTAPSLRKYEKRFYKTQHDNFYAGIDLHARSMFTHIIVEQGKTAFEQDRALPHFV